MKKMVALAASAVALSLAAPAVADRGPVAAEQAEIAKSLKAAGYVSWQGIEYDADGPLWEVDGARKADRTKWDVKLEAGSYRIVKEKRD